MRLRRLFHTVVEHGTEVLTLGCKNSLVRMNGLIFDKEHNVAECWVVYYLSHVCNERVYGFVVDFVFFEFADVEDTYVV